jgi:hypothetical protein
MHVRSTKVLLELDEGLLLLVDAEAAFFNQTRLRTLRKLLLEALETRAKVRGEEIPKIEPWAPGEAPAIDYGTDESIQTSGQAVVTVSQLSAPVKYPAPRINVLGGDIISVRFSEENGTVIKSRPVRTAHESVTGFQSVTGYTLPQHVTAGEAQTPAEVRIEGLKK